ncbi:hypothetical protein BDB01DRAFT_149050 [Pilobolus umbonatus]|nr:hypothetical protein BDB01DRAFT_149050 [Pilobolus umbonatus]
MLSSTLQKSSPANEESGSNTKMSLAEYKEVVEQLRQIIEHTESKQERSRLMLIMKSYLDQIQILSNENTENTIQIPERKQKSLDNTLPFISIETADTPLSKHLYVNKDLPALPQPSISTSSNSKILAALSKKPNLSTHSTRSRKNSLFSIKPSISTPIRSFNKSFSLKKSTNQTNRYSTDYSHTELFDDSRSEIYTTFDTISIEEQQSKSHTLYESIDLPTSQSNLDTISISECSDITLSSSQNTIKAAIDEHSEGSSSSHHLYISGGNSSSISSLADSHLELSSDNSSHMKSGSILNSSLVSICESENDSDRPEKKKEGRSNGRSADRLSSFFKFNVISNRNSLIQSKNSLKIPHNKQSVSTSTHTPSIKEKKAPLAGGMRRTKSKWQLSSVTPISDKSAGSPATPNADSGRSLYPNPLSAFFPPLPIPSNSINSSHYIHHDTQSALSLVKKLLNSISNGGYVTSHLFIPVDLWHQPNVPLPALDTKITSCDLLITILQKMNMRVNFDNYNGMNSELKVLEQALSEIRENLMKKKDGYTDLLKRETSCDSISSQKQSRYSMSLKHTPSVTKKSQALSTWNSRITKSVERIKYEISRAVINGEQNELYIRTLIRLFSDVSILELDGQTETEYQ